MIDLHSHVLPGVDDGAPTLEVSLAILRAAASDGIEQLAATPHVRDDYPTPPETMERLVAEVNDAAADLGVRVLPGGELAVAHAARLDDDTLARFGLGGNPRVVLLETPYRGWALDIGTVVFDLQARGFSVVLAHPERNPEVQERPKLLEPLVAQGVLVQLTAASVLGRMGDRARRASKELLDLDFAHLLASDAHAPEVRALGMASAVEALGDNALARWLTVDVPEAVLDGGVLPERPRRRTFMGIRRR
jgi:protein-tyrosine phosphatase